MLANTGAMGLQDIAHTARPWRIHALPPDFRLEDVTVHTVMHKRSAS